jgi:ABC-type multidrug transport system fused ATPase/permease subunit
MVVKAMSSPLPRLLSFARAHWRLALLQLCLAVLGTSLVMVFPGVARWFFDDIIPARRSDLIPHAAGITLLAFAGREFLFYLRTQVNSVFEQRMIFDLRGRLHRKIAHMPMAWFDRQSSGDLLTRMADDVPATQRVILEGIEQGITALLQIGIVGVAMLLTHWQLALLIMLPTPLLAAGGWIYARLLSPRATKAREASAGMSSLLFDTIAGIRQIKNHRHEDGRQAAFTQSSLGLQRVQRQLMAAAAIYGPLMSFIGNLGLVLLLAVGSAWCIRDAELLSTAPATSAAAAALLTPGKLTQFLLLIGLFYEPMTRLHGVNQTMVSGLASARRVFAVLDEPGDEDLSSGAALGDARGAITFEHITFAYAGRAPAVRDVCLRVEPRQTVAIVGGTGSGKSTLFQLLARFYEPSSGSITFDGQPLQHYAKGALREALGYVTQEAFLFAGTVRENLLLGRPSADDAALWEALRLACAQEFVQRLPLGLDEPVGERGMKLSGGERQRLGMARAFLKNAPVLLLDEATSAVDTKSEHLIQQAIDKLRENRTCIIIAHRLSTVVQADQIYVMRDGNVLAHGRHEELLTTCPYYAELAALAFDTPKPKG